MAEENAATSQTIGREELSRRIAKETQLTKKQATEMLNATLTAIREALHDGEEIRLVGFGSFKVRKSAARRAVNPRSRETIMVPPTDRVRFSPGKELAEAVKR